MPAACALASPSATCAATPGSCARASGPRRSSSRRVFPSTSSIAMKAVSPSRPISWIVTMLGWFSAEAARASCSNRASRSRSCASASGRTFSATSRPRRVSRARKTSPMPPAPRGARTSYAPRRVPAERVMGVAPPILCGKLAAPVTKPRMPAAYLGDHRLQVREARRVPRPRSGRLAPRAPAARLSRGGGRRAARRSQGASLSSSTWPRRSRH